LFWFSTIPLVVSAQYVLVCSPLVTCFLWLLLTGFSCLQVILAVGTKLQAIIAMMAIEITERHTVIQGMPVVKLSNDHFWFGKPHLVLQLIHFASFQVSEGPESTLSLDYLNFKSRMLLGRIVRALI
jgi:predicted membrane protein